MSAKDNLGPQFEKHVVKGSEVQVGDRLDMAGKTRVSRLHPYNGKILAKIQTRGARSPSVTDFHPEDAVHVYRRRT